MNRAILENAVLRGMSRAQKEMIWGDDDCALWVANIIKDALGYDPALRFRGQYSSRQGSQRALGKLGLAFAIRKSARLYHWKRVGSETALPGDIGLIPLRLEDGAIVPATVICRAPGWFVGRGPHGCSLIAAKNVRLAWAVI